MGLLTFGTILQNRYQIDDLLCRGDFSALHKATALQLGITIAIKENLQPSAHQAFLNEAKLLAMLKHSNLPKVTDYFVEPNGRQYLVMEFIEGKDLDEVVMAKGKLSEKEALDLLNGIFDAVSYLHSQSPPIIHRDIKPPNIKITSQGQAVSVDFGIAKVGGASVKTSTGAKGFTPSFAPIEQFGRGRTDERSDIYALGETLYFCLTGRFLAPATEIAAGTEHLIPVRQLNSSVSEHAEAAIGKAMALAQNQRFGGVKEFCNALVAIHVPQPPAPAPTKAAPAQPTQAFPARPSWLGKAIYYAILDAKLGAIYDAIYDAIFGAASRTENNHNHDRALLDMTRTK